jgi:deoxyxylulose-5-phosphate synthase
MPAARTGRDSRRRTAVIRTAQTNRGVWYWDTPAGFMLMIVVMKLMAPRIEETPARWSEKMVKSTDAPACARFPARGG